MALEIKYLGHSAFKISNNRFSILIDPFISGNPNSKASESDLNVTDILVTHAHGDHLGDAINLSKKFDSTITALFEIANYCNQHSAKAQGINMGGKIQFEWGKAMWLPASHSSSLPDGKYGGEPASILVEFDGIKIYHAGDTGLHYDMKMIGEVYKPDIALLPIGGFYTMDAEDAVVAARWLNAKVIIPMHYNTFPLIKADAGMFKTDIETSSIQKCVILSPGQAYTV